MTTDSTQISEREREVLQLVATGATNQQIADSLDISVNTVKVHLRNIFGKTGTTSRTEVTVFALRTGLVEGAARQIDTEIVAPVAPEELAPAEVLPIAPTLPPEPVAITEVTAPTMALPTVQPVRRNRLALLAAAIALVLALFAAGFFVSRLVGSPAATPTAPTGIAALGNDTWNTRAALPQGRAAFGLTSYESDGRQFLYALGGTVDGQPSNTALRYDLQNNTWDSLSAKPTAVTDVRAAVVGKLIYMPGGKLASGQPSTALEAYDQQADRWLTLAPMPAPRSGYALAAVEGKLYLFGGWDGSSARNEVFSFDPDTNQWATLKPMPTARAYADAVSFGQDVYVIGGENASGPLAVNERYTPANEGSGNPWTTRLPMPQAATRIAASTTAAGDRQIFVFGTANGERSHIVYNITKDSWRSVPIPAAIGPDARAVAVDSQLYLVGGQEGANASAQVFAYRPVYVVLLPAINN